MWQGKSFTLKPSWLETGFIDELDTALNAGLIPGNVASPIEVAGSADSDQSRRDDLTPLQSPVEAIAITPWHQGAFNGSKQDMNFWLSPVDAQNNLAKQLEFIAWESCLVLMVVADNAASLATKLEALVAVFPHASLHKALRHATALGSHESQKLFVPGVKYDDRQNATIEKLGAFSALINAKQNISISEALASDQDTATILQDFKSKRLARLTEIKTQVEQLSDQNGAVENVLYLSGGDLVAQLDDINAPNESAPLCCLLALGGSASDLAPLLEVFGL